MQMVKARALLCLQHTVSVALCYISLQNVAECHEQHMHVRNNEVPCMQDFTMEAKLAVAMLQSAAHEERVHVKKHGVHTDKTPNPHRKRRHDGVC